MNIQETIIKLLIKVPFYGYLASKLNIRQNNLIEKIKISVFPFMELVYNSLWFETLTDIQKLGILQHELLHIILYHHHRKGERKALLWAVSCDISVNQFIKKEYLLEDSITLELISDILNINLPSMKSSEEYYDFLFLYESALLFEQSGNKVLLNFPGNRIFKSDIIEEQSLSTFELSVLKRDVTDSLNFSGGRNDLQGELKNEILRSMSLNTLNWRSILKRFLSKQGKVNVKKSYKRVSRRYDNYPGTIRSKGSKALIALDESGSMSNDITGIYLDELKIINQITGVDIQVIRFDSNCTEPVALNRYINNVGRIKRGGTDFRPIFKLADYMKISQVIIFTDGDGIYPEAVNQKVLWILTKDGYNRSNFGEHVYFERQDV